MWLPVCFPGSHLFAENLFRAVVDDVEKACRVLHSLGDTQSEHLLLRYCLDACRVMHYLRGVDCLPIQELVQRCASVIRSAWTDVVGAPGLTDHEWTQSTLPMRLAGLGIKDPSVVLPPARVAACLTFALRAQNLHLPKEACVLPADWLSRVQDLQGSLGQSFEPLSEWVQGNIRLESVAEEHLSQKWWSDKVHRARAIKLDRTMTLRDRVRYNLQKMPGTTTWMTLTPNEGLGQKIEGRDYRYLLKWWLGRHIVDQACKTCPCCEGAMDPWGDHLVSCKMNQPQQRHNALRDALAEELCSRGVEVLHP